METRTDDAELSAILPEVRYVEFGEQRIAVRELTAEEWPPVVEDFKPLYEIWTSGGELTIGKVMGALLAPACRVAAATTTRSAAEWKRAGGGKLLAVVKVAVQVNADFFVHALELLAMFGAMVPKPAGLTPSPTLQAEGTRTP